MVNKPNTAYPTRETVQRWRSLSAPTSDIPASLARARAECEQIQNFLTTWPSWFFSRGDLAAGGAGDESPLAFDDETLRVEPVRQYAYAIGGRGGRDALAVEVDGRERRRVDRAAPAPTTAICVCSAPGTSTMTRRAFVVAGAPVCLPVLPAAIETWGKPASLQVADPTLVKSIGRYEVPAATPAERFERVYAVDMADWIPGGEGKPVELTEAFEGLAHEHEHTRLRAEVSMAIREARLIANTVISGWHGRRRRGIG